MQRINPFHVPLCFGTIHTLISPDVDMFVWPTGGYSRRHVYDDVKVFKGCSQAICLHGTTCLVSARSSPVSRMISEPKEVCSFDKVGLPIGASPLIAG